MGARVRLQGRGVKGGGLACRSGGTGGPFLPSHFSREPPRLICRRAPQPETDEEIPAASTTPLPCTLCLSRSCRWAHDMKFSAQSVPPECTCTCGPPFPCPRTPWGSWPQRDRPIMALVNRAPGRSGGHSRFQRHLVSPRPDTSNISWKRPGKSSGYHRKCSARSLLQ